MERKERTDSQREGENLKKQEGEGLEGGKGTGKERVGSIQRDRLEEAHILKRDLEPVLAH